MIPRGGAGLRFDPAQPRDLHGRWISIGDVVDLPGGGRGKVTGHIGDGKVEVDLGGGRKRPIAGRLVSRSGGGDEAPDGGGPPVQRDRLPDGQGEQVDRGRAAIGAAHKPADLGGPMPLLSTRDSYSAEGAPDGWFRPPGHSPAGVAIGLSPESKSKGNTFIHEYGHAVDFIHLAGGTGESLFANPPRTPLGAAAIQFTGAARRSATIQKISRNLPEGRARDYWTSPEEMWARAYAQYVAEKSGDRTLGSEVQVLADRGAGEKGIPIVWGSPRDGADDTDWPPVRDAVERVLTAGGLT